MRQFRSSRRFSIAIELVVHALKTARGGKQVTRPLDMANAFQRERKCTRCFAHDSFVVDSLPFAIAFFLFLFFSFSFVPRTKGRNKFSSCLRVFADVCRRLTILINDVSRVQKRNRFSVAYAFGNV